MKTSFYNIGLAMFVVVSSSFSMAQEEEVNVVVATGMDYPQASAMSPNNRFCALALYNAVSIWDVNTGRMLRNVNISPRLSDIPDSLWFSEDSRKVVCKLASKNDAYHVDVATGRSEFVKGPPMDYTNYKWHPTIRQSSSQKLFSGTKEDLEYTSPHGNAIIHYDMIKNPLYESSLMPYMFQCWVEAGGKKTEMIDTTTQASFAWSPDGNYIFIENSIVDLRTARVVSKLKVVPFSGSSVSFMPGTNTPVTAGVNSIQIWDFPDIERVESKDLAGFVTSYNGKYLICENYNIGTSQRTIVRLNIMTKKFDRKKFKSKGTGYLMDVSRDGSRAIITEIEKGKPVEGEQYVMPEYNIKVCDFETGETWDIPGSVKGKFTLDKNIILIDSFGMKNEIYNIVTKERKDFITSENNVSKAAYYMSRGGKYMIGSTTSMAAGEQDMSIIYVWDINTGETVFQTKEKGIHFPGIDVSKDGKIIAIGGGDNDAIRVYDFKTGELKLTLKAHTSPPDKLYISDDNKRMMSSAYDGTRRLWNLETGKEMASLVNTGINDFAIITPESYYFATKGAKKLIHFVKGDQIYPFNQFDLKYNRPDIIIKSLEASNQGLIKPFYYAYKKRLKRLGFTEEMLNGDFHLPESEIANAEDIPIATDQEKINLKIKGNDNKYNLDRVIVRVNEVPLNGKNGISIKKKKAKTYQDEMEIELSYGKNLIEVSVLNEKGVESISSNITVDYVPDKITKPNLYLYTIGVSKYKQSEFDLSFAAKDANDIKALYAAHPVPYNEIITKELTNDQVTLETIKDIKKELMKTNVDDAVCVFFAGHGVLDAELNYYLASHDMDFHNPGERGIPYEVLEDLLDDIPARKKLIMIDACHSGEIDKEEVALVANDTASTTAGGGDVTFRAVTSTSLQQVGLNNSFELMKELFNDVKKSSGTVIISSAGGMEYAMEGGEWNNGVFTYCFLNGIRNKEADYNNDGEIMLSEVNKYVRDKVYTLTNGKQQPTNRAEVFEQDWRLW